MKIYTLPDSCVLWESEDKYGYGTFCVARPGATGSTFYVVDRGMIDRDFESKTVEIACSSLKSLYAIPCGLYGAPSDDWANYTNFTRTLIDNLDCDLERLSHKSREDFVAARDDAMDNESDLVSVFIPKDNLRETSFHARFDRDEYRLDFISEGRRYYMYMGNSCVREKNGGYEVTMLRDGVRRVFDARDNMSGEAKVTQLMDMFSDKGKGDKGGK